MLIKDKLLEPLFISIEEDQYILKEEKHSDPNHRLSKGESTTTIIPLGYFTDFGALIKKVIQIKFSRLEQTIDLIEYKNQLDLLMTSFIEIFK